MTREKTKIAGEAPKPRKKLALKKTTVRDLETRGRGKAIKGGGSSSGRIGGSVLSG